MNSNTIITAALCAVLVACGSKPRTASALLVETETAAASSVAAGRTYVGEVEAATSTPVSFTGMGAVERVLVSEGQRVARGQTLAIMDATQPRNTLAAAEAALSQAHDAYARMKTLHDQQALSDMDWVEVQSKVAQAEATVAAAKKAIADCTLLAPCAGVIGKNPMESGTTALPSQPVCTILDISAVKVRAAVPEREVAAIAASTPARITVAALGGRTFQGAAIEKGVEADATTRTYSIRVRVPNADRQLLPGMVAEVALGTAGAAGAAEQITVPVRAVQQDARGRLFVWTVAGGKAHRTTVSTGPTAGNRIAIASGLQPGDRVITAGYQKVSEGSTVEVKR